MAATAACASSGAKPAGVAPDRTSAVSTPGLVSTDQLARWQRDRSVSVIDVRPDIFTYLKGHLPDAAYLNIETLRATDGGVPAQLLSARAYSELFSRLGLRLDRPVVIYSAGETRNIDATFLAWLLAGFGHPQVYVLNGGYFKWELEQRPVVQQYPRIPGRISRQPFSSGAGLARGRATGDSDPRCHPGGCPSSGPVRG